MKISADEQASQLRMSTVRAEISRTLIRLVDQMPELTHIEIATALLGTAEQQLMHQRRAEADG